MKQIKVYHAFLTMVIMSSFIIAFTSCGAGRQSPEQADSVAVDFSPIADSAAVIDENYTTYCCGNHNPSHCGSPSQLDELARRHQCTDFGPTSE